MLVITVLYSALLILAGAGFYTLGSYLIDNGFFLWKLKCHYKCEAVYYKEGSPKKLYVKCNHCGKMKKASRKNLQDFKCKLGMYYE